MEPLEWYDYFTIRYDFGYGCYYITYSGTHKNAFNNLYFIDRNKASQHIQAIWKEKLNDLFDIEVLGHEE